MRIHCAANCRRCGMHAPLMLGELADVIRHDQNPASSGQGRTALTHRRTASYWGQQHAHAVASAVCWSPDRCWVLAGHIML